MARLVLNHNEINNLTASPTGIVARAMLSFARRVESLAQSQAPVDSGRLRSNIDGIGTYRASSVTFLIGSDPQKPGTSFRYAAIAHQGRAPITTSGLMKFKGTKGRYRGRTIVTSSVAGAAGQPYLTTPLETVARTLPVVWRSGDFHTTTGRDTVFVFYPIGLPAL